LKLFFLIHHLFFADYETTNLLPLINAASPIRCLSLGAKLQMMQYKVKKRGWRTNRNGFSLLDVVIASVVLIIAILGTASYRYYSSIDQRKAAMQTSAVRAAQLLYESWRGVQGAATYNPTAYTWADMTISVGSGPTIPSGFTSLGSYAISTNDFNYTASLSWQNVSSGLRAVNVTIAWPTSGSGTPDNSYTLTSYTLY
jgi:Tfp pilus assembly protein PilV